MSSFFDNPGQAGSALFLSFVWILNSTDLIVGSKQIRKLMGILPKKKKSRRYEPKHNWSQTHSMHKILMTNRRGKKTPSKLLWSVMDRYIREKLAAPFSPLCIHKVVRLVLNFSSVCCGTLKPFSPSRRSPRSLVRLPSVIFVSALASEPHLCYVNDFFSHLPEWWRLFLFLLLFS